MENSVLIIGGGIGKIRIRHLPSLFCRDVGYDGYRWGAL